MQLPAFCQQCGQAFPSGFEIGTATNIRLDGNLSGPCPWCGHSIGEIPNGTFDFVNGAMRVLEASAFDRERLQRLAGIVDIGRRNQYDPERVVGEALAVAPELRSLVERAREDYLPWLAVLSFIGMIVGLVLANT